MPAIPISNPGVNLLRRWARLSFVYFIIAGCMGAFLRLIFFAPVQGIHYRYFLHGHSHLAFLGWVFNALFVALLHAYLPHQAHRYKRLFWFLQVSVVGMLISFPMQGYGAVSIAFSSMHIFLSYAFAYQFLKDIRRQPFIYQKYTLSLGFVQWSLFFMVLSSIGPFALGIIMAKGLATTYWYQLAIYFYLHFQYDGWFTFAVSGLFFWWLETNNLYFSTRKGRYFLLLMAMACMPAYALSTLWTHPPVWVYIFATIASVLQVIALTLLIRLAYAFKNELKVLVGKWIYGLLLFAFIAFCVKIMLQLISALPAIADMAYLIRNFTIGYLHLVFLGVISVFLIAWFAYHQFLNVNNRLAKWGIVLFLVSFVCSQLYVIGQPLLAKYNFGFIPFYFPTLFFLSLCMPFGMGLVLVATPLHKQLKVK